MHHGKIKRLLSRSVAFPLAPSGTRFAIDYKLAAKFISRMPLRRPTKGESHELLSFSLLFLDCCDPPLIDSPNRCTPSLPSPRPFLTKKIVHDFAVSSLSHLLIFHRRLLMNKSQ